MGDDDLYFSLEMNAERANWDATLGGGALEANDPRIPQPAGLEDLPRWLAAVGDILNRRLDTRTARITAGRKRSAIPAIRAWLASGEQQPSSAAPVTSPALPSTADLLENPRPA